MSSPSVLVAFRTHTWNDVVEAVFGRLVAATRHRVIICADETNGACPTPASHQKVPHTCAMFNGMGLPSFPPERVLWYNGDYPLYHLADALDWDYLFIVEYDCAIVGSIDDVIGGLIREDLGYACPNYGPRSPRYRWHDQTMKWFSRHGRIETLYGGIWGCGLISRQAVVELRRARLEMAGIVKTAADWVMFEPFVANHLRLNGFSCAAFSRSFDTTMCTSNLPIRLRQVPAKASQTVQIIHPVLASPRFEQKLEGAYNVVAAALAKSRKRSRSLSKAKKRLQKKVAKQEKIIASLTRLSK